MAIMRNMIFFPCMIIDVYKSSNITHGAAVSEKYKMIKVIQQLSLLLLCRCISVYRVLTLTFIQIKGFELKTFRLKNTFLYILEFWAILTLLFFLSFFSFQNIFSDETLRHARLQPRGRKHADISLKSDSCKCAGCDSRCSVTQATFSTSFF